MIFATIVCPIIIMAAVRMQARYLSGNKQNLPTQFLDLLQPALI
jgi:hypothetical protein